MPRQRPESAIQFACLRPHNMHTHRLATSVARAFDVGALLQAGYVVREMLPAPATRLARVFDAHVRSIYSKLEVTSRAAATRATIEHQLI